jgi:hypothetical protein
MRRGYLARKPAAADTADQADDESDQVLAACEEIASQFVTQGGMSG